MSVGLLGTAYRVGPDPWALRTLVAKEAVAMHLAGHHNGGRVEPERCRQAPAVIAHVIQVVPGLDRDIERVVGRVTDAS